MMRVAVFSDVHGNWTALQETWSALAREGGFDAIVCAGDLANGRPRAEECLQFLRQHGVTCVLGNGDTFMTGQGQPREESLRRLPFLADAYAWTRERLSPESIAFLRGLPLTARFPGGGAAGDLVVCHASPHDVWPICHPDGSDEQWEAAIGPFEGGAIAFGHVHVPAQRVIRGRLFVNAAHCGLGAARHVGYTVLTCDATGWRAERRPVPHDSLAERAYALRVGFPGADVDSGF